MPTALQGTELAAVASSLSIEVPRRETTMTTRTSFGLRLSMTLGAIALFAVTTPAQAGQTTQTQTKGTPTVTTEQLRGEVVKVEGNNLVVKMSNGELRTFSNIPDSRRATIDGVEVGVRDLKPGTRLTATITK